MFQYLIFVIFGIILYLLLNRRDGFSIGGLKIDDKCSKDADCKKGGGECSWKKCYCDDGKCFQDPVDFLERRRYLNLEMVTNKDVDYVDGDCSAVVEEGTSQYSQEFRASCYDDCQEDSECKKTYSFITGVQECKFFEIKDSDDSDYNKFGYKKFPQFLNLGEDLFFPKYVDYANTRDPPIHIFRGKVFDMKFNEYMLKTLIEKEQDRHVKMINLHKDRNGIFYCNGKLFYYFSEECVIRMSKGDESVIPSDLKGKYHFLKDPENIQLTQPTGIVHLDYQNILTPSLKDILPILSSNDDTSELCYAQHKLNTLEIYYLARAKIALGWPTKLDSFLSINNKEKDLSQDMHGMPLRGLYQKQGTDEEIKDEYDIFIDFFRNVQNQENLDFFNLWILLHASEDDKTLGFFRWDQDQEIKDQIVNATQFDRNPENLSSLSTNFPRLNVSHLENVYTFSMNPGDVLKFKSNQVPHIGLRANKGVRLSAESRYAVLTFDFDLQDVFVIHDKKLYVKTNNHTPDIIPPYMPLTIYRWFQQQYNEILEIYNELKKKGDFSIEIFKMVLDNIPYHIYADLKTKIHSIKEFLKDL